MFYHKNRLLFAMTSVADSYCGIVELTDMVRIDICKTQLELISEESAIRIKIKKLMEKDRLRGRIDKVSKLGMKSSPLVKQEQGLN
jgi:hypothetical protein